MRLIRAASGHNTLLVTERCDQLCVMCSQPPKKQHVDLFDHLELACQLAPRDAVIGISGGEPTLFKSRLFDMLRRLVSERSDLRFHVLTNGQHFLPSDIGELENPAVTWGIPLYSFKAERHDQIVGKTGAFETLMQTFVMLARAGAIVELRTVVTSKNVDDLPLLGRMIVSHLPFIHRWAIMQLENIGFARRDWATLFCDTSVNFEPIAMAMNLARARGIRADLFNFPLCTIPSEYRSFAPSTISDWKKKYLQECSDCTARRACSGFFEWHPEQKSFARISAI